MSESHTFANESISSYHIFHSQPAAATTSAPLQQNNVGYCALPTLHSHAQLQVPEHLWRLFGQSSHDDDEDIDEKDAAGQQQNDKQTNEMTENINEPAGGGAAAKLDQAASSGGGGNQQANELDPYIDVVPVRGRTNNKRGERVKAAGGASSSQALVGVKSSRDHVPDSSYYSKSVHIEESKGTSHEWDYSSGDSSDDDDDDDDHYAHKHDGHHHLYKGGKKYAVHGGHKHKTGHVKKTKKKRKRRPKKKKVHVVKVHQKPAHHHHHHGGGHYNNKHRPKKKVIYVKYKKPEKKYYEHDDNHYHSHYDKHDHYEDEHYDKHKHSHGKYDHKHHHDYHGHGKGKTVHHVNLVGGKGKMSLAGILGQTLLCINYLLVLKQPTYDKYTQHYHTRYAPYGKGDTVEIKSGGPIILAHCGELPDARALVHINRHRDLTGAATEQPKTGTGGRLELAPEQRNASKLAPAEQQHHADYSRLASIAPPSYYYTLGQPSSRDYLARSSNFREQQVVMRPGSGGGPGGLLSPIQSILSRLLFNDQPSSSYADSASPADFVGDSPIQVLGAPRTNRGRVRTAVRVQDNNLSGEQLGPLQREVQVFSRDAVQGNIAQPLVRDQRNFIAGGQRAAALIAPGGRRVILVDGQPQLVQARDNLIDMRTRRIEINMRVTEGRRFGLPQRALRLIAPAAAAATGDDRQRRPLGLAVQAPERMQMQNDQPASESDREMQPVDTNSENNNNNGQPLGGVALDLPEYALTGDSIELTCNHRVPSNRLYSVKWFKDTVEFYRFIPQNSPSRSSLLLPDVRVDLERSSSQSVHLRNVTHQTSGLYRCEVISEAPNFELLSGERRMRVYTLPDTGPRLSLLDQDEPPATVTTVLGANGQLRTITNLLAPLANSGARSSAETEREEDDDDEINSPFVNPANRMRSQQQQQQVGGPLVRCASDRSDPVAQLRFYVNNRQVPLARTLENSTLSYSDGLEANVISFRVQLSDFVLDATQERNSLDRAASLKSSADNSSTTTTSTTTTTTTTTTRRPTKLAVESKKKKKKSEIKKEIARPETGRGGKQDNDKPNANVHFDDQAEFRADKPRRAGEKRKKAAGGNVRAAGQRTLAMDQNDADEEDEAAASAATARQTDTAVRDAQQLSPLPATDKTPGQQLGRAESNRRVSSAVGNNAPPGPKADRNNKLAKGEQRTVTSSIGGGGGGNAQQQRQQQQMYSNFIRIKCASTVPTLGYEMISELQVPLTLLVPASQLSDALRQASQLEQNSSSGRDQPSQDDPAGGRPDDGLRQQLSNGGSLQQPRTVLVDRVAQASRSTAAILYDDDKAPARATIRPSPGANEGGTQRARIQSRQTHVGSGATTLDIIRNADVSIIAMMAALVGRWSIEMSMGTIRVN